LFKHFYTLATDGCEIEQPDTEMDSKIISALKNSTCDLPYFVFLELK
jgi:hypothetical protein